MVELVWIIGFVIVLGLLWMAIFIPLLELVAKRAGAVLREPHANFQGKSDFCTFGIGAVNHDGRAEVRYYDNGLGILPDEIGSEIFFPLEVLSVERMRKRGVPYGLKIVSKINGKEMFFPIYLRPDVINFLNGKGIHVPVED